MSEPKAMNVSTVEAIFSGFQLRFTQRKRKRNIGGEEKTEFPGVVYFLCKRKLRLR